MFMLKNDHSCGMSARFLKREGGDFSKSKKASKGYLLIYLWKNYGLFGICFFEPQPDSYNSYLLQTILGKAHYFSSSLYSAGALISK